MRTSKFTEEQIVAILLRFQHLGPQVAGTEYSVCFRYGCLI
jgi:hypothetical protein